MSTDDDRRQTFCPDIPSPARMYNYFLGGKDHYEVDRKAAEQVIAAIPEVLVFARENRAFLRRAVRYLVSECGIRQIIDIGTGLLVAVVHFINDDAHPAGLIGQLVRPLPPGSYVALSHATSDSRPQRAAAVERIYRGTTTNIQARTRSQVMALLGDGLELVEPGLVWGPLWRPEPGTALPDDPASSNMYAVVARKGSG
jgi:S-adenosyl methyltransferase